MEEMLIHTSGSITVKYCSNPNGHAPVDCPDAPWNHPYEADADNFCITCGQVGSYIHTRPDER